MRTANSTNKRVVLVQWKTGAETEVFSNLKNFCLSYPQYNYNTLNNYLSKSKVPFDNETVRVERKSIIARPKAVAPAAMGRSIVPVIRKTLLNTAHDDVRDLDYWLAQSVEKRAEAVTFLVSQMLKKGQRMDKTVINKIRPGI